jgi:hypothetical protein
LTKAYAPNKTHLTKITITAAENARQVNPSSAFLDIKQHQ